MFGCRVSLNTDPRRFRGTLANCALDRMNNYLAKPVKPNTLKALLESYLSKETPEDPNLQHRTNKIVEAEVSNAASRNGDVARAEEQQNGQEPKGDHEKRMDEGVRMAERLKNDHAVKTPDGQDVRPAGGNAEHNGVDAKENSSGTDR